MTNRRSREGGMSARAFMAGFSSVGHEPAARPARAHFLGPTNYEALTNAELFELCNDAMTHGRLSVAHAAADELCRPERARKCTEELLDASVYTALDVYSTAQLQPLQDRIEQYNSFVRAGRAA